MMIFFYFLEKKSNNIDMQLAQMFNIDKNIIWIKNNKNIKLFT